MKIKECSAETQYIGTLVKILVFLLVSAIFITAIRVLRQSNELDGYTGTLAEILIWLVLGAILLSMLKSINFKGTSNEISIKAFIEILVCVVFGIALLYSIKKLVIDVYFPDVIERIISILI